MGFLIYFLMIRLGLYVLRKETSEGKMPFLSHYQNDLFWFMLTPTTKLHIDIFVDISIYTEICIFYTHIFLPCFSMVSLFFSLYFYTLLFGRKLLWTALEEGVMLNLLEGSLSIKYLEFLSIGDLSVLHLFSDLCISLHMSVWIHGYLFGTLGYNSILYCCSACFSFG